MERCPICRASLNGAETCRRCRAELGSAIRAGQTARRLEDLALYRLALGDADGAARAIRRALLLARSPTALALNRVLDPIAGDGVSASATPS